MLVNDLRLGLRMMLRTPVVSAVAILSLGVGIAANASMFALLNGFFFEPFPYEDQEALVMYRTLPRGETNIDMSGGVSVPGFGAYLEGSPSIADGVLYTFESANLTGLDIPEQLSVVIATPSIFEVLGVQPALGRGFRPEEGAEGAGRVLVLHHDYWQSRFFGSADVLGRSLTLDGEPYTVIGVMPEAFDMIPADIQAIRPSDFTSELQEYAARGYLGLGRLRAGASPTQAQRDAETVHERLSADQPEALRNTEVVVQQARSFFPGPTDTQLLKILTVVTLFGLLIACANVANLLLSRAEERQKEVAVRTALGAGRGRVVRQMLTESVLLGGIAGALGVALSIWVVGWLRSVMPAELPKAMMPELDPEVVGVTLLLSLLAGIAFGMVPAFQSFGGGLTGALGSGARGGTAGRRRRRIRAAFVVAEVAVALALLTGSGFLIQAFDRLANDAPGFEPDGLLSFALIVPEDPYATDAEVAAYGNELVRVLSELPAVEGVAIMSSLPRGRSNPRSAYTVDGRPETDEGDRPTAGLQSVNAAYFGTMDIELRRGRLLGDVDRADAAPVAVVNEAFARSAFPQEEALGRRITVRGVSREIVGVVEDVVQDRIALAGRGGEQIYLPVDQAPLRAPSFAVRAAGDPAALASDVRRAVWSVNPAQPIARLRPLQAHIDESLAGPKAISLFLTAMGAVALALAAMGIYGVMAHSVTQRRHEIGIRMALGADRVSVVGMVARSGLGLIGVGVALGLPIAYLMLRAALASVDLFAAELGLAYPALLASALVGVALLAIVLPARRASGVAPGSALRE